MHNFARTSSACKDKGCSLTTGHVKEVIVRESTCTGKSVTKVGCLSFSHRLHLLYTIEESRVFNPCRVNRVFEESRVQAVMKPTEMCRSSLVGAENSSIRLQYEHKMCSQCPIKACTHVLFKILYFVFVHDVFTVMSSWSVR